MSDFRICLIPCLVFQAAALAATQTPAPVPQAPVPAEIRSASKIFVSNAGGDSGLFPSPFTGDSSRAYNQLYAGLKANGQFQLLDQPSDADLVLEIQLTSPSGSTRSLEVNKINGAANPLPMLRLVVYDRPTHYILWTFSQSIDIAYLQKTHDRNFDDALNSILFEFETLSGKSPSQTH
jgi:hypothetical protein